MYYRILLYEFFLSRLLIASTKLLTMLVLMIMFLCVSPVPKFFISCVNFIGVTLKERSPDSGTLVDVGLSKVQ